MLITLDGCSGVGKSVLAAWLIERHRWIGLNGYRQDYQPGATLDTDGNTFVIQAMKTVMSFHDLLNMDVANIHIKSDVHYVIEGFWTPMFLGLYQWSVKEGRGDLFRETIKEFHDWMRKYFISAHMHSFWLDAPYSVSDKRARTRNGVPLLAPSEYGSEPSIWDSFAREMANFGFPFYLLDATQSPEDVQKQFFTYIDSRS